MPKPRQLANKLAATLAYRFDLLGALLLAPRLTGFLAVEFARLALRVGAARLLAEGVLFCVVRGATCFDGDGRRV